ncbi:hypothetical protein [Paraburkholderia sp. GAS334]|uniref:hypothetical protein n=1 Tax=Paraburkholderia sp. GAS334 TaxID=3035131 RepID=UPI003D262F84
MATETERVDRLVEESSYVFKATVTQLNASNEPAVRPGPGLIVAHVDEAFRASPSVGVGGLRGREVTMLLAGSAPALGDKLLVFATDWLYGVQIALREVDHLKATAQAEKEVAEAVERLPIRRLEARLDGAVLVVDGEVESIGASPVPDGSMLRSPNYRLAVVRVVSTLKGKGGERVSVLFPTNPAPPWRVAPRLKEHEAAIFILRHETALKAPEHFLTALDPDDVQSRDLLREIKSLLKQ